MPSNPNRRVKLTMSTPTNFVSGQAQGFRLIVTASDANLMPNEIFQYLHLDPTQGFPSGQEVFQGVCSIPQLTYPVNTFDPNQAAKFYRTAHIDITYPNIDVANNAWSDIVGAVQQLKTALDYADGLSTTTFWVGTPSN